MARIAFAIELGGQLGHVKACGALASSLALRGHQIAFLLSEYHDGTALEDAQRYSVFTLQSGLIEENNKLWFPCSYADVLTGCGYDSTESLAPLAARWRAPLAEWKPDLLIADYAPTSMLCARAESIPCINFGTGFSVPPRLSPLPPFRLTEPDGAERAAQADAKALAAVNGVLQAWGKAPLTRLCELLDCEEEFLCTFPELDQYGVRPESGYWGPRFQFSSGARMGWPARGGKKIFVYLKRQFPQLDIVLELLAASEHRAAIFVSGLSPEWRARLIAAGKQVSDTPIRVDSLVEECDLAVSHGGELTTGTLTHGVPQLVFPLQYEQLLTGLRVEQMGAGKWLSYEAQRPAIAQAFVAVMTRPEFTKAARAFRQRYPAFSPREQRRRMVVRVESVIARTRGHAAVLPARSP